MVNKGNHPKWPTNSGICPDISTIKLSELELLAPNHRFRRQDFISTLHAASDRHMAVKWMYPKWRKSVRFFFEFSPSDGHDSMVKSMGVHRKAETVTGRNRVPISNKAWHQHIKPQTIGHGTRNWAIPQNRKKTWNNFEPGTQNRHLQSDSESRSSFSSPVLLERGFFRRG